MCLSSDMVRSGFGSYCRIGNRFAFPFLDVMFTSEKTRHLRQNFKKEIDVIQ